MSTPFIHQTDLFHPHGDPDDHWDLACVYALAKTGQLPLKGVLIDYPPPKRDGDPDVSAVAQLACITGITGTPVLTGTSHPMRNRNDTQPDAGPMDLGAVNWLIRTLRETAQPLLINIVGSCTDVAVAGKREPELFAAKCRGIYLNAGSAHAGKKGILEYNVALNPSSYSAIFDLPCPLYWCPCWHDIENRQDGANGTFYAFMQGDILPRLSRPLQNFFLYMLSRSTDPKWLCYLAKDVDAAMLAGFGAKTRKMWSTAGILHAGGLTVEKDGSVVQLDNARDPAFSFRPISVKCHDSGIPEWSFRDEMTNKFIFQANDTSAYARAMTTALGNLLSGI